MKGVKGGASSTSVYVVKQRVMQARACALVGRATVA